MVPRKSFSFVCAACGAHHEGSPSVGYDAPYYWTKSHDEDRSGASRLSKDLCKIEDRDYFIRCVLEMPIHGVDEPFLWGVWVTQSQKNFELYAETFDDTPDNLTFGYLANRLPGYAETLSLQLKARWQAGGRSRPLVELRPCDHTLYTDWSKGISWERAIELDQMIRHAA